MSLVRTTSLINTNSIFFHSTYSISNNKILFRNSLLLFHYKSTKQESSISVNQEDNINNENRSSASINTILKNSFVKEDDIPWTGEEDIKTTVLRMVVDKYPPLKIKRNSIKEYIDAHSKVNNSTVRANLIPPPNLSPPPLSKLPLPIPVPSNNVTPNKNSTTKHEKIRDAKQSRLISARDAATDYSINKKFCAKSDENVKNEQQSKVVPKSIAGWNSLVERRIQEAMAAGEFKNLPYRGKPLPTDPNERNPYLDRTEFFMNRLVQRQGAAPEWIEYQKDIDREIHSFRQLIRESWIRYTKANNIDPYSRSISWEHGQSSYYEKVINKLNSRLRSYNTIAPYPVRRNYLSLKLEFERMYQNVKHDISCKTKVRNRDQDENGLFKDSNSNFETKKDDNILANIANSIRYWIRNKT